MLSAQLQNLYKKKLRTKVKSINFFHCKVGTSITKMRGNREKSNNVFAILKN